MLRIAPPSGSQRKQEESGFGLVEFLMSTLVVMSLSAGIFTILTDMQSNSGYQAEVLSVMENTRVGMSSLGRIIVQAGSNPRSASFTPVTITSSTQVQICADVTGSSGGSQGDPDGDILDTDENVTILYNSTAQSIELIDGNGTTQTLANHISAFTLSYFDRDGNVTSVGADVRKIRVTISGSSTVANPRTKNRFGLTLTSDFTLPNRG
jgi:Tfp pilus assembly protein PilW